MKICPKCGVDKPLSEYYKNYLDWCKACRRKAANDYCKANRDKKNAYEQKHKEHLLAVRKKWRDENKERQAAIWARSRAKKRAAKEFILSHIPPATHKWCRACNEVKQLDQFNIRSCAGDGLDTYCRICSGVRRRAFFSDKERAKKYRVKYIAANRHKVNAYNKEAKLRRRKTSVVAWADKQAIAKIYAEAAMRTAQTGVRHEVDHIIPLKHPLVCGLHVPENLRVVTRSENARKSNKYEPA